MKAFYKNNQHPFYTIKMHGHKLCTAKNLLLLLFFIGGHAPVLYAQQQINIRPATYLVLNGSVALVSNNSAINNNGIITPGNATFYFTGYSDTTVSNITGSSTTTCTNLTINKNAYGTAIKSLVNVTGVLTMAAGNLYPDSNLTLISTAANTARVAPVPASCSIIGKAFVQRYIPARRAWRLMTAPVTSSNTIYDTWQNSGVYTVGLGTYITSPVHTAANGMDASPANNYSLYTFNAATQKFAVATNTKIPISSGSSGSADNNGYFLFVRGDRNPGNVYIPNCNTTTLSCLGKLQTGNQTFTASGISNQYTLVGNPYASPLDFSQIARTNIVNRFYAWDPKLNTLGAFVVLDDIDGDGIYDKSIASSGQTKDIQSSQAFFIQAYSTAAASITISESAKSTNNNNLVFRPANILPKLTSNLYLVDADTAILADGGFIQFDNRFSDSVDLDDAKKIGNTNENLGFVRYGVTLAIERRPDISINDTLFLKLTTTTQRNYRIELVGENINHPELTAYLQDQYLNSNTPVNLYGNTNVDFNINADAASANANRFFIYFKPASILPLTFISIKAYSQQKGINVDWITANETGTNQYTIEKSADGKSFNNAATVNTNTSHNYTWLEANPFNGDNFYRIKSIAKDGRLTFSEIVKVATGMMAKSISVYPNPIQNNNIHIQFSNQPEGNYHITLLNAAGQIVYKEQLSITASNLAQALAIPTILAKGAYELNVKGDDGNITTQKISVQ